MTHFVAPRVTGCRRSHTRHAGGARRRPYNRLYRPKSLPDARDQMGTLSEAPVEMAVYEIGSAAKTFTLRCFARSQPRSAQTFISPYESPVPSAMRFTLIKIQVVTCSYYRGLKGTPATTWKSRTRTLYTCIFCTQTASIQTNLARGPDTAQSC